MGVPVWWWLFCLVAVGWSRIQYRYGPRYLQPLAVAIGGWYGTVLVLAVLVTVARGLRP